MPAIGVARRSSARAPGIFLATSARASTGDAGSAYAGSVPATAPAASKPSNHLALMGKSNSPAPGGSNGMPGESSPARPGAGERTILAEAPKNGPAPLSRADGAGRAVP